jgi:hypothetical protein
MRIDTPLLPKYQDFQYFSKINIADRFTSLDISPWTIIIPLPLRWCWNWQTGMVEGHVPQGVWVQLPPSALNRRKAVCFFLVQKVED